MYAIDPRNVLYIRTDRLGETLLNLPAAAALRAALPGAMLTLLINDALAPLLSRLPWVDAVIAAPPGPGALWWTRAFRLAARLRRRRFDLVIISNAMKELHVAAWLAGIPLRVGYDRKWGGLLTHRLSDRKALGDRHEVEYNLDLVRALKLPASVPPWRFPRLEREQADVLQRLEQQGVQPSEPFVAVHPWTSNPHKRWPADRYAALMRRMAERLPARIVVVGEPEARTQVSAVLPAGAPIAELAGRCSLIELAALLQRARLVVSNDSGPVHLAAAVGTPTVVLFGASEPSAGPVRWGPWGSGHTVIWKPSMDAISVEEVFRAVQSALVPPDE